ncbi:hypothetical protein J1N35_007488 [Gossypium stocksii]|uniref:Uncharacterized protein n=1 Tax=Gossypium stocksii TaxID=47602 RepID=A0A9D3W8J7_9ROSI|nr:hypothetical protein J1N35_007488 [Gossypium stocksii]
MVVPLVVKKKSAKAKTDDEPIRWECRLERDVRFNMRLLDFMKPFMDTFMASQEAQSLQWPERSSSSSKGNTIAEEQEEEVKEKEDNEATEDGEFTS